MAAQPSTTLGAGRAVTAPSRRHLIGGSILAALSGAAFAGAVMLPDPGEASPLAENPDAPLIALCAEFFRVTTASNAIADADDAAFTAAMEARDTLAQRISATRAATAAGLQAKAGVGNRLMHERHSPDMSLDDVDTYALALLRELMAGSVSPAASPAGADAELIRLCAECAALQAKVDALWAGNPTREMTLAAAITFEHARDIEQAPFLDAQDPLLERICELRATTAQGHAARARTLLAWDKDPIWTQDGCWNSQLIGAIVRDLVEVA